MRVNLMIYILSTISVLFVTAKEFREWIRMDGVCFMLQYIINVYRVMCLFNLEEITVSKIGEAYLFAVVPGVDIVIMPCYKDFTDKTHIIRVDKIGA